MAFPANRPYARSCRWPAPGLATAAPATHFPVHEDPMTPALTRRGLLRAGGAAGAAAVVGTKPWAPAAASAAVPRSPLLRSSYTTLRSTQFAIDGIPVTLARVSDLPAAATVKVLAGSEEAFSLLFAAPTSAALASGIHTFRQRELGQFELFVAPVEIADDQQLYEVVVNSYSGRKLPAPPKRRRRPAAQARPHNPRHVVVRWIAVRRIKRGLGCRFSLAKKPHVKTLSAWLMRGERVV